LHIIEEALGRSRDSHEHWWDAELYLLRGKLMLAAQHDAHDAEAALVQAADIARSQQCRSLELRAVLAVCQMSERHLRAETTRRALSDLYTWFTEGFDTPDLQAAKSLLAQGG